MLKSCLSIPVSLCLCGISLTAWAAPTSQPASAPASAVQIQLVSPAGAAPAANESQFTARFTAEELTALLADRSDLLPTPFHFPGQQEAYAAAVGRIDMDALAQHLKPFLDREYPGRFLPERDLLRRPIPEERQAEIPAANEPDKVYHGPGQEVLGFLVHDITEADFRRIGIQALQIARQLIDSGEPLFDRLANTHLRLKAERELIGLQAERTQAEKTLATQEAARQAARRRVGQALGVYDEKTGTYEGEPSWGKESRRFSYVIKKDPATGVPTGEFIDRLAPLATAMNADLALAGFPSPSPLDKPGISFDQDLKDVEILLPRPMLERFLFEADRLEQRMAEDHIISVEAVRLTDRDITEGAIASRLNLLSQGVHDVTRNQVNTQAFQQFGINSLLAVANRQLQVSSLRGVESGRLPAGTSPITLPQLALSPATSDRTATTIGSDISIGADDLFFDGRQQSYGFSYIGPDGLEHTLSLDVVDSLRDFWDRIERNLLVHKIKKCNQPTKFTVPVGPSTNTFDGIAALISQEKQDIVITNDSGALVRLSATAGTWLIIQDFAIEPTPGSSTTLTEAERRLIKDRVMLTMFLRDPNLNNEIKTQLLDVDNLDEFEALAYPLMEGYSGQPIRGGLMSATYGDVLEERSRNSTEDAALEKKERNSIIKLSFYSSQGNIISTPGSTELGDANDLTSFTTELRPNEVTPISSFFTKSSSGATGTSPMTGVRKGEQSSEEKTMTHLVVRVRFPTRERERMDREEGRHLGYFNLPLGRTPHSTVDLPFLSSSDHPLDRLAKLRVGLMFDSLKKEKVKQPLELINPNSLMGTISQEMWETATTRLLMNRKIIANSPGASKLSPTRYRERFNIEVRSLLEYDDVFFDAPNLALRNMTQWNDPNRILAALHSSPNQFALQRLIKMLEELGDELVPLDYVEQYLGISHLNYWDRHRVYSLSDEELKTLRRDVANHYLRIHEVYGDAFLEAVSQLLGLASYRAKDHKELLAGPFRGYHDLVLFNHVTLEASAPEEFARAHDQFALLKRGGYVGEMFEPSFQYIEDLDPNYRPYVIRGRDVLESEAWWEFFLR